MMNFQTKFREGKGFVNPVGPPFSTAKKWNIDINGTQLEFRAPKHRPMVKSQKGLYPDRFYRKENYNMFFKSNYSNEWEVKDIWEHLSLFNHDWAFNGPWFTGCLAHISMSVIILKQKITDKNISFFHPRALEQTIGDYLTNNYSLFKDEGKFEYKAPVNWQSISGLSVVAARLQVVADGTISPHKKTEYVFFPIDDHHIISISFRPSRSVRGTEAEIDKKIGYKNLGELIDNIINSVKITLSPEAKAQQEKALEGLEDTSLTDTFLPMDWSKSKVKSKLMNDESAVPEEA